MSSNEPEVMRLLGQIDGKLDQVISSATEHRADDIRRFTDVYGRLEKQDEEINKAKGAKGVLLWMVGGGAAAISALISAWMKAKGG